MPALSIYTPNTTQEFRKGEASREALVELQGLDISRHRDDFQGDLFMGGAAPGIYQSTASGNISAVAAVTTGAGGRILLDSGDANSGRSDLSMGLYYSGELNAICWWRAKVSSVATEKFELGFTDVVSGTDAGAVNLKATPTFTADDAVVLCFDTTHNTTLQLMGVAATVAATPITLDVTLASDTFYYFGVELRGSTARGWVLDNNARVLAKTAFMTGAVTSTVLLTPWAFQQNRAGSAHSMTIDLLDVYSRRSTS